MLLIVTRSAAHRRFIFPAAWMLLACCVGCMGPIHAVGRGTCEKCARNAPCDRHRVHAVTSEVPPPGRFHPVPTRPVFGGHEWLSG
jgi:hypothetical protein